MFFIKDQCSNYFRFFIFFKLCLNPFNLISLPSGYDLQVSCEYREETSKSEWRKVEVLLHPGTSCFNEAPLSLPICPQQDWLHKGPILVRMYGVGGGGVRACVYILTQSAKEQNLSLFFKLNQKLCYTVYFVIGTWLWLCLKLHSV